ncbi:hypothetical protein [Methylobacterium fujisawaense]|uniref:hypothetical protein n=1 Tax=Methylobacterium fujisawaense TaxID=107400 RepID=UPI00313CE01E
MTPDMKRICDAAHRCITEDHGDMEDADPSFAEAIVRAVLMALRDPSDAVKKAAEKDTEFYGCGEYISYDAGETIARAVDFILAEPARA